jgi:hypothetical protein
MSSLAELAIFDAGMTAIVPSSGFGTTTMPARLRSDAFAISLQQINRCRVIRRWRIGARQSGGIHDAIVQ